MPHVTLEIVAREAAPVLANLLELYCHDLSYACGDYLERVQVLHGIGRAVLEFDSRGERGVG